MNCLTRAHLIWRSRIECRRSLNKKEKCVRKKDIRKYYREKKNSVSFILRKSLECIYSFKFICVYIKNRRNS